MEKRKYRFQTNSKYEQIRWLRAFSIVFELRAFFS